MSVQGETRSVAESRMYTENQQNAGGIRKIDDNGKAYYDQAPRSDYPRMLYKATEHEQIQEWADAVDTLKDKPMVINRFDGLLCETCIVHSATEAEALAEMGWDLTPKAAHGQDEGLVKAVSAKDDRIAELEAMLAAREPEYVGTESESGFGTPAPRRGRPPKTSTSGDI